MIENNIINELKEIKEYLSLISKNTFNISKNTYSKDIVISKDKMIDKYIKNKKETNLETKIDIDDDIF